LGASAVVNRRFSHLDKAPVKSKILELEAKILQKNSPLDPTNIYLIGCHPLKNDPSQQIEAHPFLQAGK